MLISIFILTDFTWSRKIQNLPEDGDEERCSEGDVAKTALFRFCLY